MALNNLVTLIGNMGSEVEIYESKADGKEFAAVSIATADSYQNDAGEWIEKETVWHNVVAFSPSVMEILKNLKKGTRVKVEGSLSYRPYDIRIASGEVVTKKEASIVARRIEQAPLVKKSGKSD